MVESAEIKNFAQLLKAYNMELVDYKAVPLIPPGENYGSVMLAVEATIKENGARRHVSWVAKTCPTSEFIQHMFDTKSTFRKEICFYREIVPALQEFLRANGVPEMDFYPPYVASRLNLEMKGDIFDPECALVMENIKKLGFTLGDRMQGFDLQATKVLLKTLAKFHAVPIAYKLKQPKKFEEVLMPHLNGHPGLSKFTQEEIVDLLDVAVECLEESSECRPLIDRFKTNFMIGAKNYTSKSIPTVEPFTTMTHNDIWTNNTMIKIENGQVTKNVLVDFQMIDLGNPGNDVVFFLLSSIQYDVMDKFDELLQYYYDEFIDVLQKLKCDIKLFTYQNFLECIDLAAKDSQLFHLIPMLKPILMLKKDALAMEDMSENMITSMQGLDQTYFDKLWHCVKFYSDRNWI